MFSSARNTLQWSLGILKKRIIVDNNNTFHARVTTCACRRFDAMERYNYVEQNTHWADQLGLCSVQTVDIIISSDIL